MAHEPSRFQADTKRPMKLMAADPFLAAAHQECALEPDMQSNMALFKNRPDLDRKLLTAIVALPQPYAGGFASKAAAVIDPAAMRADRTLRPQDAFQLCESGGFVVEVGLVENAHDPAPIYEPIIPLGAGCVKSNIADVCARSLRAAALNADPHSRPCARARVAAKLGLAVEPAPAQQLPPVHTRPLTPEEARRNRKRAIKRLHADLITAFPRCFAAFDSGAVRPLKIGVDRDLIAAAPELIAGRKKLLGELLKLFTSSGVHLATLQPGAERIALDGEPAGDVTAGQAENAADRLQKRRSA